MRYVGSGEHHRMKGDVTKVGGDGLAKVKLDDGTYLDDVKEKALETVVPSVDDDVYILRGSLRLQKGRIRSKDREREEVCVVVDDGRKEWYRFDDVSALSKKRR